MFTATDAPPPPGLVQVPSALRKLVVPPPEAGTSPEAEVVNKDKATLPPVASIATSPGVDIFTVVLTPSTSFPGAWYSYSLII